MINNFARCLAFTLLYEGDWSDNPHDPGGATMHGITLRTYSHVLGRQASMTELRNIPSSVVAEIYRQDYWNYIKGDTLPSGVDLLSFDIAVNMGVGRANQFLLRAHKLPALALIHSLDQQRLGFWRMLRNWKYFNRGWVARENACLALALKMESGR